jgi:hypothetical protein
VETYCSWVFEVHFMSQQKYILLNCHKNFLEAKSFSRFGMKLHFFSLTA